MDRRKFLAKMTLGSAFAWVTSKASLSAQQLPPAYANAVPVVAGPAGAGLSPADLSELFTINANASPEDVANTYPQSVASGDPNPNGALIWTRVNPAIPIGPGVNAIAWQVASDPAFGSLKAKGKLADAFTFDSFDHLMTLREGVTDRIALYNDGIGRMGMGVFGGGADIQLSGLFSGPASSAESMATDLSTTPTPLDSSMY